MTRLPIRFSSRFICLTVLAAVTLRFRAVEGDQRPPSGRVDVPLVAQTGIRGGLVVHVGCGDGRLTAALRTSDRYLVHGLDTDWAKVAKAREYVLSLGLYGPVSVDHWDGEHLPYADNLVNLAIVSSLQPAHGPDTAAGGREALRSEIMRALAPGGRAIFLDREQGVRERLRKPLPPGIDEWTHLLHGPDNNAVAQDTVVGPPRRLKWLAGPTYVRHHEHRIAASIPAMVSAGGRVFAVEDDGPAVSIFLPSKWSLTARDAWNGVLLWRRPLTSRHPLLSIRYSGSRSQTLVAVGEHVYVALGMNAPVSDLDAATGKTLRTFEGTQGAEQVVCSDSRLYVVAGAGRGEPKRVLAFAADKGTALWEKSGDGVGDVFPLTLAVEGQRLFFQNSQGVVCLDAADGTERWRVTRTASGPPRLRGAPRRWTLVVSDGVVLFVEYAREGATKQSTGELIALSAETGQRLWSRPCAGGWGAPVDVFVIDGVVWFGAKLGRGSGTSKPEGEADFTEGLDLRTGAVKQHLDTRRVFLNRPHHHRCHRDKATTRYLVTGRHGVEMIPLNGDEALLNDWVRGGCVYGVMPSNGLLYMPPHPCRCYSGNLLTGFCALASARGRNSVVHPDDSPRLERGPAYGRIVASRSSLAARSRAGEAPGASDDWPTYRHDPGRSGCTRDSVPAALAVRWRADIGGALSSVVIADGRLLVAQPNAHTVHALDARSGKPLWRFTAGGRVDSPPTVFRGAVLFGSRDGWLYCLRAEDGQLVWRFRGAPEERRIVVDSQLESAWPIHGSILVTEGVAYVVAGRSPHLDGGMMLYRIDVETGHVLQQTRLERPAGEPGAGGVSDILSSDGRFLYMRLRKFPLRSGAGPPVQLHWSGVVNLTEDETSAREPRHLICTGGMLNDSWWHRATQWVFGKSAEVKDPLTSGRRVPTGQILVFDRDTVYGYGRKPEYFMWTSPLAYRLFAAAKTAGVLPMTPPEPQPPQGFLRAPEQRFATHWSTDVPLHVRAIVLAENALVIAGPPDVASEGAPERFSRENRLTPTQAQAALDAWMGESGALLRVVAKSDGAMLAEYRLESPPVFDGMAAAGRRLYLSTMDGKVVCLGKQG